MKSSLAENTGSGGAGAGGALLAVALPGRPRGARRVGVGVSARAKNVGSHVMIMFASNFTACPSTSSDASAVVTIPVTAVDGSPALNVSTVSGFHSTPTFFLMRSTIACAVTAFAFGSAFIARGAAATLAAARDTNLRREMGCICWLQPPQHQARWCDNSISWQTLLLRTR